MAILSRVKQKIFGDTGLSVQFGKIGSESAGSPVTTKDLEIIQELSEYDEGLFAITNSGEGLPLIEDFNSLFLLITSQLAYLFQNGIPEWEANTNYYANISFVTEGGVIYQAITGTSGTPNNNLLPSANPSNWRVNDGYTESVRALAAEALLAPKASPTFTGTVVVPTATGSTSPPTLAQVQEEYQILRREFIQGLLYSYSSTTVFSISSGAASSDDFSDDIVLASSYTKSLSSWAVGTGNGSLDTGTVATNTWYFCFAIKRPDTGVVDILISTSLASPTMPANYTLKRPIFAFRTNASSQIPDNILMLSNGEQWYKTPVQDISDTTLTSTEKSYNMITIPDCKLKSNLMIFIGNASPSSVYVRTISTLDNVAVNAGAGIVSRSNETSNGGATISYVTFDSNVLKARGTAASTTIYGSNHMFNIRPFN